MTRLAAATIEAIGTSATIVVADDRFLDEALSHLIAEIEAIDLACSRFRTDSEVARVNSAAGREVSVSPLLIEAVEVALRAAAVTDGVVDPTVGSAMRVIGYDRDLAEVARVGPAIRWDLQPVRGWRVIEVDRQRGTVKVPCGVELDLGATAKALCADRAVARAASAVDGGVLVSLGGDISVAGRAPEGGWVIQLTDDHADPLDAGGPTVSIPGGGLATSSTAVRRWKRGEQVYHHLVDPATGASVEEYWRTVTVAAGSCVDANIASTAAIVLGQSAVAWLHARRLPARLVQVHGAVVATGGWPEEPERDASVASVGGA
jgi:FAD:protein FMN transferase